jgi:signal transduction histidine kinase
VRHLTAVAHLAAMDQAFTELTSKNQHLERAVSRLEEVDRLKSNFLATMSHELRTPLTSVIGYAEMLHEGLAGTLNDEQRDYVQTILGKADQLLQIITSILDVSLLESGQRRIEPTAVALPELAESVVASFASQARKRRLRLVVRTPDKEAPLPRALGDSRKIRQVIWNLLSNAVKFTPEGGEVSVAIGVGPLAAESGDPDNAGRRASRADDRLGVRVVVTDSGIGIPPEKQAHIFEPFFQVDSSSTREYGGTGLGLTLAKSYVEAHGGQIRVDSAVGKGSTFTVSFPAVAADLEPWHGAESPS